MIFAFGPMIAGWAFKGLVGVGVSSAMAGTIVASKAVRYFLAVLLGCIAIFLGCWYLTSLGRSWERADLKHQTEIINIAIEAQQTDLQEQREALRKASEELMSKLRPTADSKGIIDEETIATINAIRGGAKKR